MTSIAHRATQTHPRVSHRAAFQRPLWGSTRLAACLLVCLCVTTSGCTTLVGRAVPAKESVAAPHIINLTYHTDSGRLNQVAAGRREAPLASDSRAHDSQASATPVPPFTTSTLTIEYPHPDGVQGHARLTARFESGSFDARTGTLWHAISGEEVSEAPVRPHFREVWQDDIQDWQLASLIAQLHGKHFFRRINVIGSDAYIATNINGDEMAKDFSAVAELDHLLIGIRRTGRAAHPVEEDDPPEVARIESPLPLLE